MRADKRDSGGNSERDQYPRWCHILRDAAMARGMTQARVADATARRDYNAATYHEVEKIGLGKIKRIWTGREEPTADEMLRLCEVLDLPKVRMLAELGKVEQESDREAYIDHLEELAARVTYAAGLVEVEQVHGAGIIAAKVVATGKYRVTIAPLIQGTGRFRRHYSDLVAVQPLPGQAVAGLRKRLEDELRHHLAWFHAGFIGVPETAEDLRLETPDTSTVINVPRFLAVRRGSGSPPEPLPRCVCVVGSHWSGSADVACWLAHAFDLDSSHVGFVASRAFSRLTHKDHDVNAYDREEVARTYTAGAERLGRRRVWAVGGDNCLHTFQLLDDPQLTTEPHVVYLRAKDDLMQWTAVVRYRHQHSPTKTRERDLFDMQEERRKMDEVLKGNRLLRRRTVILPVGLPPGTDFTNPTKDGRDEFFDMWAGLAEQALTELHSIAEPSFDLQSAMNRLRAGGRSPA